MYAGAKQVISGNPESTFLNQGLQSLGMSPQAAGLVEAAFGIGSAATATAAANKAIDQAVALGKLSAASYRDFATNGVKATPEVMQTSQVRALVDEIRAENPRMDEAKFDGIVREIIASGSSLPAPAVAAQGSVLIKVVPKGDAVTPYTPFWLSPEQARAIATMTPEQAGQALGLPAAQAAKMFNSGMDFYAITPKSGATPKTFVSGIAPTTQGAVSTAPSAQQIIVPNRSQWSDPKLIDPFTLR